VYVLGTPVTGSPPIFICRSTIIIIAEEGINVLVIPVAKTLFTHEAWCMIDSFHNRGRIMAVRASDCDHQVLSDSRFLGCHRQKGHTRKVGLILFISGNASVKRWGECEECVLVHPRKN